MNSLYEQVMTTLYSVWRKRWYGLAAMWAVCLIGWFAVAMIPNQYESNARILVAWNTILPQTVGYATGDKLRQIDIVRQTLTSRPNLEKVIRRTDLGLRVQDGESLDRMIADMTENITVKSQENDLFTISYVSADPDLSDAKNAQLAQAVVQNLIGIFVEDNTSGGRDDINQTIRFIEDQLAERERELEVAEKRKADFEQKYLGRLPGEGNISSRLAAARAELDRVGLELSQARSSLAALNAQLSSTPATIQAPSFIVQGPGYSGPRYDPGSARGRIEQLERSITEAYARGWTDAHPDVVSARQQIKRLEAEAKREERSAKADPSQQAAQANPVYTNLRSMLFDKQSAVAALSARQAKLQADISDMAAKQIEEPGIAAEQARLNRDYDVLKRQYEELLKSREELRLRSDVENKTDQVRFRPVDPPSFPREPIAPNRPLLLTVVLLAGLAIGAAVAFAASQIHTTYITSNKLQQNFGLPVLGSVSEIVTEQQRAQNRMWLWGFAVLGFGLAGIYAVLLIYEFIQRGNVA